MGVVVYWNAAAQDLYGWTPGEAIGRNIAELTVPEVGQDTAADIMAALRDGVPWSGGFPVRRKDGTRFPALVTDAGVYRDGVLVGIVGVSTNLGAALRPLLERSTDAALVLRADGVVTYASPAVGQLFGWSEEDIIGAAITTLLHPDDRDTLGRFLQRVLAAPGAHPPVELRVRRDRDWVWAEAALTNLLDDPTVRGVVCNLRVSLRRTAQEEAETQRRAVGDGAGHPGDHRAGQGVPRRPHGDHRGRGVRGAAPVRAEPSPGDAGRVPPRRRRRPAAAEAVNTAVCGSRGDPSITRYRASSGSRLRGCRRPAPSRSRRA